MSVANNCRILLKSLLVLSLGVLEGFAQAAPDLKNVAAKTGVSVEPLRYKVL